MLKICAIGDIVGKAGRNALNQLLPVIKKNHSPDIIICNGENAAGGFGLTKKVFDELTKKIGVDVITMGNHWHDKPEIYNFAPAQPNIVLPGNMGNVENLADGMKILTSKNGIRYAVINLIGTAFMKPGNACPFQAADELLSRIPQSVKVKIVDFHAEATSEKQALGHYLAERVSLFYGTHTHTPTADERVLKSHTAFATDVGMTGAYDSVIGIKIEASIARFIGAGNKKFEPAKGDPWVCALVAEIEPSSGKCANLQRLRLKLSDIKD